VVATLLPLPLIVLDPRLSIAARVAAFLGPTVVHLIIGNFVEPMVFGQSMELHPVTVLLALALWYSLWGISGAILAVPITACFRIAFDAVNHPYARVVIAIMEGRLSTALEESTAALEQSVSGEGGGGGGSGGDGDGSSDGEGGDGGGGGARGAAHSLETEKLLSAVEAGAAGGEWGRGRQDSTEGLLAGLAAGDEGGGEEPRGRATAPRGGRKGASGKGSTAGAGRKQELPSPVNNNATPL
jgi:hypothetical protein